MTAAAVLLAAGAIVSALLWRRLPAEGPGYVRPCWPEPDRLHGAEASELRRGLVVLAVTEWRVHRTGCPADTISEGGL